MAYQITKKYEFEVFLEKAPEILIFILFPSRDYSNKDKWFLSWFYASFGIQKSQSKSNLRCSYPLKHIMFFPFPKSSMPTYLINWLRCTTRWLRCFSNIVIPLKSLSLVLITKSQPSRNPSSPLIQRIMVTLSMKRRVPLLLARDLGSLIPATPHSHHQLILPWFEGALPEYIPDEDEVPLSSSNSPRVSSDFGLEDHANICVVCQVVSHEHQPIFLWVAILLLFLLW